MDTLDGCLMEEHVVLATQQIEPYVLEWPLDLSGEARSECTVLILMRRTGGLLLALPVGALPDNVLEEGNSTEDTNATIGPSTVLVVPGMLMDGGAISPTGEDLTALVVDCSVGILNYIREFAADEERVFGFDEDSPFAFPSIDALVPRIHDWALSLTGHLAGFYTPEEPAELESPVTPKARRQPAQPKKATTTGDGAGKPKRVTNALLADQIQGVVEALPRITEQLNLLSTRQALMESQMLQLGKSAVATLAQPLGSTLSLPAPSVASLARTVPPPPRTATKQNHGLLASPGVTSKPLELEALELEKGVASQQSIPTSGDALAHAVLAQSQALTSLVAQIANQSGDPMGELTSSSSTGTRGATGRAKLQAELALHRGTFFRTVVQSMSRRMSPTSSSDLPPAELLEKGISGVRYLERFGGYGRQRELGLLQFQVMTAMDFMMAGKMEAAMDTVVLLAVAIEQASLDGGRMDLASLLTLQEDPPASIFVNRQLSSTSRARSFAPLATLDHMLLGVPERARSDHNQEGGVDGPITKPSFRQYLRRRREPRPKSKAKGRPQEERWEGQRQQAANQEDNEAQ